MNNRIKIITKYLYKRGENKGISWKTFSTERRICRLNQNKTDDALAEATACLLRRPAFTAEKIEDKLNYEYSQKTLDERNRFNTVRNTLFANAFCLQGVKHCDKNYSSELRRSKTTAHVDSFETKDTYCSFFFT